MKWTSDVAAGDWLRTLLDDPWQGTIHDVVPRGYEAYARVLHPVRRDRPVGQPWPPLPYATHRLEWERFTSQTPEIEEESVTWSQAAAAFGTTLTATTAWRDLVAPGVVVEGEDGARDAEGWRYHDPELGQLEPQQLAAVASHLAATTSTPDDGYLTLWEGWGGLVGHLGPTPSRAFLTVSDDARHSRLLSNLVPERFRSPFAKDRWQPGIVPDDVSRGPRLELPHRGYVLCAAGVSTITSPDWVLRAPWRDREAEEHGFPPSAHSPSLLWPADRAWVLVSEVDWDSTVVAGSQELVSALVDDPSVEAVPLAAGAVLAG